MKKYLDNVLRIYKTHYYDDLEYEVLSRYGIEYIKLITSDGEVECMTLSSLGTDFNYLGEIEKFIKAGSISRDQFVRLILYGQVKVTHGKLTSEYNVKHRLLSIKAECYYSKLDCLTIEDDFCIDSDGGDIYIDDFEIAYTNISYEDYFTIIDQIKNNGFIPLYIK